MAAEGKGNKGKGQVKGKGRYYVGTNCEDETEDTADHQEKEKSEQQSEGTTDDAWWLGSMKTLTREPRIRWALPTPQKVETNRFAVLSEPDTDSIVNAATHAASGIQRKTTMRLFNLGRRKTVSWSQGSKNGAGTLAFRAFE